MAGGDRGDDETNRIMRAAGKGFNGAKIESRERADEALARSAESSRGPPVNALAFAFAFESDQRQAFRANQTALCVSFAFGFFRPPTGTLIKLRADLARGWLAGG